MVAEGKSEWLCCSGRPGVQQLQMMELDCSVAPSFLPDWKMDIRSQVYIEYLADFLLTLAVV